MTTGRVRSLRHDDLEAVAALRLRCFRHGRHQDWTTLAQHFDKVFLGNPWRDTGVEALVYEDATGDIVGFRGLIGRPMRFRGEPVVMAVSSQFMVDPNARNGQVAFALMRASLQGPQDLMIADLANPSARKLWALAGGVELVEWALLWRRPIRPLQSTAARLGSSPGLTWSLRLARPFLSGLDRLAAAVPGGPYQRGAVPPLAPLTLDRHCKLLANLGDHYDLVPVYDPPSLEWTLTMLKDGLAPGQVVRAEEVIAPEGAESGFFLAVLQPGGAATVVQLGGASASMLRTTSGLVHAVADSNCTELTGRLQPELLPVLAAPPAYLTLAGPGVMVSTRRPEMIDSLRSGRAWFSRLEGEWWMGF